MNKFGFLSGLFFFGLIYSITASALFGTNWADQKTYCNKIKDVSEMINCDRTWERLKQAGKLPKNNDDFEICGKIFEYYKEIKPMPSWSLASSCLELISYRNNVRIPKDQMKMCDWLLEKGKSVERYIFCLQEFDPTTLKICEYPKSKDNYQITGNCLKSIQGFKLSDGDVKTLVEGCLKSNGGEDYVKRVTLTQWDACLTSVTGKYESTSVIDFATGAFTGTGR